MEKERVGNNRYEVLFNEVKGFNKKYHNKHKAEWTIKEVELIMTSDKPLVELSIELGRTANAICQKRKEVKMAQTNKGVKKVTLLP